MKPMLIAFTGPAGCGKTTAAQFLVDKYGYYEASFAKAMKIGLKTMLCLDDDQVFGDRKKEPIERLGGKSPRDLLQSIGTDWGRDMIHPDIWLMEVKKQWEELNKNFDDSDLGCDERIRGIVISDLRFDNEADWVRSQGGVVVHIEPDGEFQQIDQSGHISESGVYLDLKRDAVISNHHRRSGNLTDFWWKLSELMSAIHKHKEKERRRTETGEAVIKGIVETWEGIRKEILNGDNHTDSNEPTEAKLSDLPQTVGGLQASIAEWADAQFPDRTITNALCKLVMEEIPEYLTSQHDPMELADIAILVFDVAHLAKIDLKKAIDEKMEINKKRQWKINPETGLMNHVK